MVAVETCRTCGAQVLWAVTSRGKLMPLDAQPVGDGNLILDYGPDPRERPTARPPHLDECHPRYRSHFASCPQASMWRGGAR